MWNINYDYDQKKEKGIIRMQGLQSYKFYRYQNIRGIYEYICYNKLNELEEWTKCLKKYNLADPKEEKIETLIVLLWLKKKNRV